MAQTYSDSLAPVSPVSSMVKTTVANPLAFLSLGLMASAVYFLFALNQTCQDIAANSQKIATELTQFKQQLSASRILPDTSDIYQETAEFISSFASSLLTPHLGVDSDNSATETTIPTETNTVPSTHTATRPAVNRPIRASSTTSHDPFSLLSRSSDTRSVAERMAANNQAVDERVDAALKSRESAKKP